MGVVSNSMLAKKQRLLQLDEALNALELAADSKKSIPVYRVCECNCDDDHCGCSLPAVLPSDYLVIELGCKKDIPKIALPADDETWKSRAERKEYLPEQGCGLGPDGVKRAIQTLKTIRLR